MNSAPTRSIACPFCGLICDDLRLDARGVDGRGCDKAARGFARGSAAPAHQLSGRPAELDAAAAAAADILRRARRPLITGLGTDLAGIRALLALADRAGAVIDRWQSGAQLHNLSVVQDSGAFTATFGEVANRADVVLLIAADPIRSYPRLAERLLRNPKPLYRGAPPTTALLGPEARAAVGLAAAERLNCPADRLIEVLSTLSALLAGHKPRLADVAGMPLSTLERLVERLRSARYGAIVWDAAVFAPADGEIAVQLVLEILRALNRKTRCVGLPLGGSDNGQGAVQAMLWQTGWPGRLSFARGAPEHDPWRYDAGRLVQAGEVDALVWVAAIAPDPPPDARVPTIALVAHDVVLVRAPEVAIRVGIPGLDHAGAITRADNVITLPLTATRPSAAPSVAAAAAMILERLRGASS